MQLYLHTINFYSIFVVQSNEINMNEEMKLTPEERELIVAIRNVQKSKHNPSKALRRYAKELFDNLLNE